MIMLNIRQNISFSPQFSSAQRTKLAINISRAMAEARTAYIAKIAPMIDNEILKRSNGELITDSATTDKGSITVVAGPEAIRAELKTGAARSTFKDLPELLANLKW